MTKGAPDVLIARCSQELVGEEARPLTDARRAEILKINEELAGGSIATLGVHSASCHATSWSETKLTKASSRNSSSSG